MRSWKKTARGGAGLRARSMQACVCKRWAFFERELTPGSNGSSMSSSVRSPSATATAGAAPTRHGTAAAAGHKEWETEFGYQATRIPRTFYGMVTWQY